MKKNTLDLISKVKNDDNDGSTLHILTDSIYRLETVKYVCSDDGEYAIDPDEFIIQASKTPEEKGCIFPTDLILIHDDGTTDLLTDESECGQGWTTVSVYHNGKEVADDVRTMSEEDRKAAEALIGSKLEDITGLGVWNENNFNDMEEGPITPSELLSHMSRKNRWYLDAFANNRSGQDNPFYKEEDDEDEDDEEEEYEEDPRATEPIDVKDIIFNTHYEFTASFKDGTRMAVLPEGIDGDKPKKMLLKPKSNAKPFKPFYPWGSYAVTCSGEAVE